MPQELKCSIGPFEMILRSANAATTVKVTMDMDDLTNTCSEDFVAEHFPGWTILSQDED